MVAPIGLADLISLLKVIRTIIIALDQASGTSEDFQELVDDIDGFRRGLEIVKQSLENAHSKAEGVTEINLQISRAITTMDTFCRRIAPYRASFSKRQPSVWARFRKTLWALIMRRDVKRVRERMTFYMSIINLISK